MFARLARCPTHVTSVSSVISHFASLICPLVVCAGHQPVVSVVSAVRGGELSEDKGKRGQDIVGTECIGPRCNSVGDTDKDVEPWVVREARSCRSLAGYGRMVRALDKSGAARCTGALSSSEARAYASWLVTSTLTSMPRAPALAWLSQMTQPLPHCHPPRYIHFIMGLHDHDEEREGTYRWRWRSQSLSTWIICFQV